MLGRFIFNRIGALVIGILALGFGVFMFTNTDVMCGSDAMQPGDTCITTSNGTETERDYNQQKAENATSSYVLMGIGGVVLVGGIIASIRHATKKKQAAGTEPVAAA